MTNHNFLFIQKVGQILVYSPKPKNSLAVLASVHVAKYRVYSIREISSSCQTLSRSQNDLQKTLQMIKNMLNVEKPTPEIKILNDLGSRRVGIVNDNFWLLNHEKFDFGTKREDKIKQKKYNHVFFANSDHINSETQIFINQRAAWFILTHYQKTITLDLSKSKALAYGN